MQSWLVLHSFALERSHPLNQSLSWRGITYGLWIALVSQLLLDGISRHLSYSHTLSPVLANQWIVLSMNLWLCLQFIQPWCHPEFPVQYSFCVFFHGFCYCNLPRPWFGQISNGQGFPRDSKLVNPFTKSLVKTDDYFIGNCEWEDG